MGKAGKAAFAAVIVAGATLLVAQGAALAQTMPESCQKEFIPLFQKRQEAIQRVNNLNPKKTTAAQACSAFKNLEARNKPLVDYMTTNRDWCQFTEEQVSGISQASAQIEKNRSSACSAAAKQAAQIRQMQRQQQQQGGGQAGVGSGVRLPQGAL